MKKDLAILVLIVGVFLFFLAQKAVDLSGQRALLAETQARLSSLEVAKAQIAFLQQNINALEAKLPELQKSLPQEADLGLIVKLFSSFASSAGLQIQSISSTKAKKTSSEAPYKVWEIEFSGGTYSYKNILRFLKLLKNMKRALAPVNLSVKYNNSWEKEHEQRLVLRGRFKTYIRR